MVRDTGSCSAAHHVTQAGAVQPITCGTGAAAVRRRQWQEQKGEEAHWWEWPEREAAAAEMRRAMLSKTLATDVGLCCASISKDPCHATATQRLT